MNIKPAIAIFGLFLTVLLVACAKAPIVQPTAPEAPAVVPSAAPSEAALPAAPEAKFELTKQAALRNPSRVVATITNVGEVDSSIELTVSLIYAKKAVATKTVTLSIARGESKEFAAEFPDVTNFVSYSIEGTGLVNPAKPSN